MVKVNRFMNCLLIILLFVVNCMIVTDNVFASEKVTEAPRNDLRLKIYSFMPPHKASEKYTPFMDYLSSLLNRKVTMEISADAAEHIERIGAGDFDLAFITALNYAKLLNIHGKKEIMAILSSNDNPYFHENIVVSKTSPYKEIKDLNKKDVKFAFSMDPFKSDILSYMLTEGGIDTEYLKNRNYYMPKFAYHEMVESLTNQVCVAGIMDDFLLSEYEEKSLRSISKSGPIPAPMLIANDSLLSETIAEIKAAISSLHQSENGKLIISTVNNAYNRFLLPDAINFDYINRIVKKDVGKKEISDIGKGIMPWEKNNGCPPFYLKTDGGKIINPLTGLNSDKPYSTRKTCGFCHDYGKISKGYHFQMGMNERENFNNKKYPWKITPGMTGGW